MSCLCPREAHDQELTDAKVIMGLRGSFPEPYFCTLGYKKFPLIGIFALVSGQKSSEIDFWNLLVISTALTTFRILNLCTKVSLPSARTDSDAFGAYNAIMNVPMKHILPLPNTSTLVFKKIDDNESKML